MVLAILIAVAPHIHTMRHLVQFFDRPVVYADGSSSQKFERWFTCDHEAFEVDVFIRGDRSSMAAKDCDQAYQTLWSDGSVPCHFFPLVPEQ